MASGSASKYITFVLSHFHLKCDGKTIDTVVASQGVVLERWMNDILLAHAGDEKVVVGLDIKHHFVGFPVMKKSGTMQLCIDTKCLIIQLFYINKIPQSFKSFLMNPKFTFVGVDGDMSRLVSEHGLDFAKRADFRAASIYKWPGRFKEHDLKYLAKELAAFDVTIPHSLKDEWGSEFLTKDHIRCACVVAYASYKIGKALFLC